MTVLELLTGSEQLGSRGKGQESEFTGSKLKQNAFRKEGFGKRGNRKGKGGEDSIQDQGFLKRGWFKGKNRKEFQKIRNRRRRPRIHKSDAHYKLDSDGDQKGTIQENLQGGRRENLKENSFHEGKGRAEVEWGIGTSLGVCQRKLRSASHQGKP